MAESPFVSQLFSVLNQVSKPARYIGGEPNMIRKDPGQVQVRAALAFPEIYEIGMSHHGIRILYHLLNRRGDTYAERVFAPWVDMAETMRVQQLPLLTLETKTPLREFDWVGFSLQSELTYTNVLLMLELAGIPVLATEREEADPLICAGGPCMANPEPLADFIDFFVIGDGEEVIGEIVETIRKCKKARLTRKDRLQALSEISGVYAPAWHRPPTPWQEEKSPGNPQCLVQRRWVENLAPEFYPTSPIVPLLDIVQDRISLEIMRGCTEGCRFCQAGYFYRPARELKVEEILRLSQETFQNTGTREIGLLSLSTADYSQVDRLTREMAASFSGQNVSISLPSLRADKVSVSLAQHVGEVKKNGLTFAPEAGSLRLRQFINKNISNGELFQAIEMAYAEGWNLVKLYFMIGLPTETEEDLKELVELIREVGKIGKKFKGGKRVNAAIGTFVPKAFTPFQWDRFEEVEILRERLNYLKSAVRFPFARLKWHDPQGCLVEAVLARGDRHLGKVIWKAYQLGCRFDGWDEHFRFEKWMEAFEACGLDPRFYARPIGYQEVLPWDHIDIGVSKKYLLKERQRSDLGVQTRDCKWGDCHGCGIPGNYADIKLASPPKEPVETGVHNAGPEDQSPATVEARPSRPARPAEEFTPCILFYRKLGPSRFLSHLNVMQLMERAIVRAGLELRHTEGFNPHPKIATSPALSLGIASRAEYLLFDHWGAVPEETMVKLNRGLMEGLEVVSIVPRGEIKKSRFLQPRQAVYSVVLPAGISAKQVEPFRLLVERTFRLVEHFEREHSAGNKGCLLAEHRGISEVRAEQDDPNILQLALEFSPTDGPAPKLRDFLARALALSPEIIASLLITREEIRL